MNHIDGDRDKTQVIYNSIPQILPEAAFNTESEFSINAYFPSYDNSCYLKILLHFFILEGVSRNALYQFSTQTNLSLQAGRMDNEVVDTIYECYLMVVNEFNDILKNTGNPMLFANRFQEFPVEEIRRRIESSIGLHVSN